MISTATGAILLPSGKANYYLYMWHRLGMMTRRLGRRALHLTWLVIATIAPSMTHPGAATSSCTKPATTNSFIASGVQNICANLSRNSQDANLSQLLSVIHDPVSGIDSGDFSRQRMELVILCGKAPFFDSGPYVDCNSLARSLGVSDPTKTAEWRLFQMLLAKTAPSGYPGSVDARLKLNLSYIHLLSATANMDYKVGKLTGCTGASKTFAELARFLGYNVMYVTTFAAGDYKAACACTSGDCVGHHRDMSYPTGKIINGHQVVAVQVTNGNWRILNSSATQVSWALDFQSKAPVEVAKPEQLVLHSLDFGFKDSGGAPVRYVVSGVRSLDFINSVLSGPDAHDILMNLYVSGSPTDSTCRFRI
jgi:hypothetical protein